MRTKLGNKAFRARLKFLRMTVADFALEAGVLPGSLYGDLPLWADPFLRVIEERGRLRREIRLTKERLDFINRQLDVIRDYEESIIPVGISNIVVVVNGKEDE